jgi:hypothetical protein
MKKHLYGHNSLRPIHPWGFNGFQCPYKEKGNLSFVYKKNPMNRDKLDAMNNGPYRDLKR